MKSDRQSARRKSDRNVELCKLYGEGWNADKLAKRYGITKARVYKIINRDFLTGAKP